MTLRGARSIARARRDNAAVDRLVLELIVTVQDRRADAGLGREFYFTLLTDGHGALCERERDDEREDTESDEPRSVCRTKPSFCGGWDLTFVRFETR